MSVINILYIRNLIMKLLLDFDFSQLHADESCEQKKTTITSITMIIIIDINNNWLF